MSLKLHMRLLWAFILSGLLLTSRTGRANDELPTGILKGIVLSLDGKPVAFVSVQLKGTTHGTFTDENGAFELKRLSKGDYILIISHTGLASQETKVSIQSNQPVQLSIQLKENAKQLEQIIVKNARTSNIQPVDIGKMPVSPRDYPQAVQIINSNVIADQQDNRLADVMRNINGVALGTTRGAVSESFYARGYSLGNNNIFKNGSRTNSGGQLETSTLESVEVLKGSAALLYGGVSSGAVVNLVTKQPKFQFGGEVSLRAGSNNLYKPMVDVYGPISQKMAFRVVGTYETADSYRDKVNSERFYVNPSLLYKFSDRTTLNLSMDYLKTHFTPDFGIGSVDGKIRMDLIPRNVFLNTLWAFNKVNQVTSNLNFEHKFNNNWKMNVTASYQNYDRDYYAQERLQIDAAGGLKRSLNRSKSNEDFYTAQVNFIGNFKVAGLSNKLLFGFDGDETRSTSTTFNLKTAYDSINVFNPATIANQRTDMPSAIDSIRIKTPTNRFGAYIQDLISITGKLKLLAGIRWSFQESPRTYNYNIKKDSSYRGATAYKNDKAFSPRLGLVYQPLKTTSLFASYSNSFSPNSGVDINNEALKPSIIDQYEIGVKNDFFNGKLSANLTVYKIINNNLAIADENDATKKKLAGQTTSDGFEIDLSGALSKNVYFLAGFSNNYMRYTKTAGDPTAIVEGERVVNTTANTANGTVFYTFDKTLLKGVKLGLSAFYTGDRLGGWNNTYNNKASNLNRNIPLNGFTTFDFSAGYTIKKISLLAKLSNITNVYNVYVHENYSVNPIPPRQIAATLSYKF